MRAQGALSTTTTIHIIDIPDGIGADRQTVSAEGKNLTQDQPGIPGGSTEINGRSTSNYKSSVTRSPATRIDGRSAAGKRVRDLFKGLMERLDSPDDIVIQSDILALVELKVMAEAARLRILEGKDQNTNGLVRLENLVRRAEARVGLAPGSTTPEDPDAYRYGGLFVTDDDDAEESAQ